ncbi:deoxyguanosinetriphosphate triphosphohydrolase [Denitrovibrio acetiphilus DSM 12809]|uniref:Deoxyguanosinetriphosphate triphosphohydrolase n=1 Tax=Denitrovibrio acetiphilus (strain DSM 12809 / NBRC 114555 / N2460) TaxID=522772 RepID=D4H632_DENA2|nr:deoxyguanosinetriphosphate triphosphohydrolase [Denitrovibrio acetiphilus]ADD67678.1 deoxyguanosinetriphosphate triphosphohydrolase [Denitrovibrio acetiphilus DSM 12809]
MDWTKLLSSNDFFNENKRSDIDLSRSPFQRDFDRIIFSENFRRLDKKTQVHPLKDNDHVHSRLPHSLEVSCVGRSLGSEVGKRLVNDYKMNPFGDIHDSVVPILTGQIVQSACLAHDIGNPPFGHAGEELIQEWFRKYFIANGNENLEETEKDDLMNFEGNAQAFRVLTKLAMSRNKGGIQATSAVVGSMLKYPWAFSKTLTKSKFCAFTSEIPELKTLAETCGLKSSDKTPNSYSRHPFAFLSEAADDICYNLMDLEDAYELHILNFNEVTDVFLGFFQNRKNFDADKYLSPKSKQSISHLRAMAVSECVNAVVEEFFDKYSEILRGDLPHSHNLIENCNPKIADTMKEAKRLSHDKVFTTDRKTLLEISANTTLSTLLDHFCGAAYEVINNKKPSGNSTRLLKLMGENSPSSSDSLYSAYQKVTDYISGMTDNYAVKIAKHLNGIVD